MKVLNYGQVFGKQAVPRNSEKYARVRIHRKNMPDKRPKVSVVLLDWSCRERFHALDWLLKQDAPRESYEIIWIELYDRLAQEALEKADTVITCNQNGMYHKHIGYNVSLLNSNGEIIVICDSDAVYPPDFISSIIKSFNPANLPEPQPLVLMHYELRTSFSYPENLRDTEELKDDKWRWWPLNPNAGACMSVRKQDAVRFGGFDEHESFRGYLCGPYDLGWRLVNAGIAERWHDTTTVLWHFAHPDPVGVNELAPTLKRMWENTYPHVDLHALTAVEALVTGRLLPLAENPDIFRLRMASRRIGTRFEEKYARMITQKGFLRWQVFRLRVFMVADIFWTVLTSSARVSLRKLIEVMAGKNATERLRSLKHKMTEHPHPGSADTPVPNRALIRAAAHALLGEKGFNRLRSLKHEIKGWAGKGSIDPLLVSAYKGCNLVRYHEQFFGIPHFIEYVDFRDARQRRHPAIVTGSTLKEVMEMIDKTDFSVFQPELERCYKGYDIVRYMNYSFAIPHGCGLVGINDKDGTDPDSVLRGYVKDQTMKLVDQNLQEENTENKIGRVLLGDNRMIMQAEHALARQICKEIKIVTDSRGGYIQEHMLDPAIFLPGGNWTAGSSNNYRSIYKQVLDCEYMTINNLRQFTQPFSGFQLPKEFPPEPDRHVHDWIRAVRHLPPELKANPPRMLGEVGWDVGGAVVNHDTYLIQERLNLLYESGLISWMGRRVKEKGHITILEIGAGYGGLAHALKNIFPRSDYFICDLPECMLFSSLYLSLTMPDEPHFIYNRDNFGKFKPHRFGFSYIANYMFDELVKNTGGVDLTINALSFSEMSAAQVDYYALNLSRMLGTSGVLFEQNQDNKYMGLLYSKDELSKYLNYRETIASDTIIHKGGVADIWANVPVRKIISEKLKPFFVEQTGVRYD